MSEEYQKALALEADRERKWRQTTRQGRFESAMLSLDALRDSFEDPDSVATFSDGGVAAESIRSFDEPDALAAYEQKKKSALNKLRNRPHLQRTLRLIIENGTNRKESVWTLMTTSKKRPGGRQHLPSTELT